MIEQETKTNEDTTEYQHRHDFLVATSEHVIVRWCPGCGKSWRAQVNGPMYDHWQLIKEPMLPEDRP